MTLKLYNTLTKTKATFEPLDPDNVRMYVCGPTVYDYAHIGNARPVIVFDVLFRVLRHIYGEDKVTYVRNITDVDDKINARAAQENISIRELTERTANQFHEDIGALGVLPPTVEPRATEHIEEMKTLIEALVERGHAYVAEDHVLFQVSSMKDYGALSRRSLEEMEAGARVEVAPYKKDPMDFVLWKPSKENEPSWPSPCGIEKEGRPGWHIECSAMSAAHLGKEFDIHGGGIDLTFPHHENEVAQSRCAHGTEVMANVWMHNGFLQVEGEKMSKSLGNFITIHDLLTGWHDVAWHGTVLRLAMLKTHYRQPINWTHQGVREAAQELETFKAYWNPQSAAPEGFDPKSNPVYEALLDDLNTPKAISELHSLAAKIKSSDEGDTAAAFNFAFGLKLLGLDAIETYDANAMFATAHEIDEGDVQKLIDARIEARKAKDWAEADRIRDELTGMGIVLKDAKDPESGEVVTSWEVAR